MKRPARPQSKRKSRCGTPELILATSMDLFNQLGERQVTTNHIAQELGMSSGNLYYHYGSKEEIILALVARYLERFKQLANDCLSLPCSFDTMLALLNSLLQLRWEYRFILNGKFSLFLFNHPLRDEYFAGERIHIEQPVSALFERMRDAACLVAYGGDITLLARQFSLLQEAWLGLQPAAAASKGLVLAQGQLYMLRFIYPNLCPAWQQRCDALFASAH